MSHALTPIVATAQHLAPHEHQLPHLLVVLGSLVFLTFLFTPVCFHALNLYTWIVGGALLVYGAACARRHQKPGTCGARLHTARCGHRQGKGCGHVHTWVFGRLDEWLQLSLAEGLFAAAFVGWLGMTFGHYFAQYTGPDFGENGVRAAGRALAQVNVKMLPFIYLSVNKNTWLWHLFAVSPERGYLYHKMTSRFFVFSVCLHVVLMVSGGTDVCVQWDDEFDLTRPNLWPGIVALVLTLLTGLTALPSIRRNYFEWFYFNHIQVSFPINVFAMFHAREHYFYLLVAVVWFFQIDVLRRVFTKAQTARILGMQMVSRQIYRIELVRQRYGILSMGDPSHVVPGAYLWLSFNKLNQSEAASGGGLPPLCIPPADKLKLPSWLMFHPITIASAPGDKTWVVYIKDEGNGGQWANALGDVARSPTIDPVHDMNVHIGGPHGGMRMKPQDYEVVVLCVGGVGAALATAILGDYAKIKSGYVKKRGATTKIVLLWACRSAATFAAFEPELRRYVDSRPAGVEYDLRAFLTRDASAAPNASSVVAVTQRGPRTAGHGSTANSTVAPLEVEASRKETKEGAAVAKATEVTATTMPPACPALPLEALKTEFEACPLASKKAKKLYLGREFYSRARKVLAAEGSPAAADSFATFFGPRAEADKGKGLLISWEDFLMLDGARKADHGWIAKEAAALVPACLKLEPATGRPDFRRLLAQIKADHPKARHGAVFACGPNALMLSAAQASQAVNKDGKPGLQWSHHTEDWEV